MTIREIKNEIEALGFGDLLELSDALVPTLNRCITIIETAHPRQVVASLPIFPKKEILLSRKITSDSGGSIEVAGGQLKFKLQGTGTYRVNKGPNPMNYQFSTLCRQVTVDFPVGGSVEFLEGDYTVFDISLTKSFPSPLAEAVCDLGESFSIDLAALYPDLYYLTATPTDSRGKIVPGLTQSGPAAIRVPKNFYGTLMISYRAKMVPLDENLGEDFEVNISPELLPLLVLLAAYYLWLDDDREKAEDYKCRYDELSAELKKASRFGRVAAYENKSRWA